MGLVCRHRSGRPQMRTVLMLSLLI